MFEERTATKNPVEARAIEKCSIPVRGLKGKAIQRDFTEKEPPGTLTSQMLLKGDCSVEPIKKGGLLSTGGRKGRKRVRKKSNKHPTVVLRWKEQ